MIGREARNTLGIGQLFSFSISSLKIFCFCFSSAVLVINGLAASKVAVMNLLYNLRDFLSLSVLNFIVVDHPSSMI